MCECNRKISTHTSVFLLFDTNNGVIAATVVVVVGGGAHVCTEIVQLEAPCFSLF